MNATQRLARTSLVLLTVAAAAVTITSGTAGAVPLPHKTKYCNEGLDTANDAYVSQCSDNNGTYWVFRSYSGRSEVQFSVVRTGKMGHCLAINKPNDVKNWDYCGGLRYWNSDGAAN